MSYVQDNLMPNEKVLFTARIHPAIFISSFVSLLIGVAVLLLSFYMSNMHAFGGTYFPLVLILLAVLTFLSAISSGLRALITMTTTEFAVTDRRVIAKSGFIRRHTLEMLLTKVESVAVNQHMTGRMMNFGSVTVTGTGGTKESFTAIAEPFTVRRVINQTIEQSLQEHGSAKAGQ
jgi:uncharacterized membrane protein YdbT with pleckstrin-like domain